MLKLKERVKNLPELSDSHYRIAGYVVSALITLSGLFLVYEVLFRGDLTFSAQWNIFKSPLGTVCIFIGFIWAMCWWGKFTHWSSTPVIDTVDSSGRVVKREENFDVMEQGFAKIVLPLLGHFVIEPIFYGCIIYYPLQCIIALVGAIFPYVLSLLVTAIIVGCWIYAQKLQMPARTWVLVLVGVVLSAAFALGGYVIFKSTPDSTIQMVADTERIHLETDADEHTSDTADTSAEASQTAIDEEEEDQFGDYGEEGLMGSLPEGTSNYEGDMDGFPIELAITKDGGTLTANYKNVKSGTTMFLNGESLPAEAGSIYFYGQDGDDSWTFDLSGDALAISGKAICGEKILNVTLKKK